MKGMTSLDQLVHEKKDSYHFDQWFNKLAANKLTDLCPKKKKNYLYILEDFNKVWYP